MVDLLGINFSLYFKKKTYKNMSQQTLIKKIYILNKLIISKYYIYFLYLKYA